MTQKKGYFIFVLFAFILFSQCLAQASGDSGESKCKDDASCSTPTADAKYTKGHCNMTSGDCVCVRDFNFDGEIRTHYGKSCSQYSVCPKNCTLHGTCHVDSTCICDEGFQGSDCSTPIEPKKTCIHNCSGHGHCNEKLLVCQCFDGFFGIDCSLKLCPNNCTSPDRGSCNYTTGVCHCDESKYFDVDCSKKKCINNCFEEKDWGICNEKNGKCVCSVDRQGIDCSLPYIECPNNCSRHGLCNSTTGICSCNKAYFGSDCSKIQCPDPKCSGHGECDTHKGRCLCDSSHVGEICEFTLCVNNCTGSNGICNSQNGTCQCHEDWMGIDCSENIHLIDLQTINYISQFFGTAFIVMTAALITFSSFSNTKLSLTGLDGYVTSLLEIVQFVGISALIGNNIPYDYLKFASCFVWSNYLFNLGLYDGTINDNGAELSKGFQNINYDPESTIDIRKMLGEKGLIVFLDNFIIVSTLVIVTIMMGGAIGIFRILKQSANRTRTNDANQQQLKTIDDLKNSAGLALVRLSLVVFTGLCTTIPYEIALAFEGRFIGVSLIVAISLMIALIFGLPVFTVVVLRNSRSQLRKAEFQHQFGPLYTDFTPDMYLFMVIILVKKMLLGFSVGMFQKLPRDQLIAILIILIIYLLIVLVVKPFKSAAKNHIDSLGTVSQLLITFVILLTSTGAVTSKSVGSVLSVIMIFVQCGMILLCTAFVISRLVCHGSAIAAPNHSSTTAVVVGDGTRKYSRMSSTGLTEEELNYMNRSFHSLIDEEEDDDDGSDEEDDDYTR